MLWFDNDENTSLTDKIKRAAEYYRGRYKKEPNLCFVHPSMIKEGEDPPENMEYALQKVSC